jgi:hypothetical protein
MIQFLYSFVYGGIRENVAAHVAGKEVMSTNNHLTEMNHPMSFTLYLEAI